MKTLAEKFWSKVEKSDGCWLWIGATTRDGYGKIGAARNSETGTQLRANRVSWLLHFGEIPEGKEVLHRCDNPPCIRPDHFFLGSQSDNVRDMDAKGRRRMPRGEEHGRSKLTVQQVLEIRQRAANGERQRSLAQDYGVWRSLIGRIVSGQAWTSATVGAE